MTSLNERYEKGQAMRSLMAGGDLSHFTLPGIDQLAPDLKRIINESLFGSIWSRPGLDVKHRCICTISALMALGQLPLATPSHRTGPESGLGARSSGGGIHPVNFLRRCSVGGERS